MTTQPEALYLADVLDCSVVANHQKAAAELRRLHAVEVLYNELVFAVGNKYADETRHKTALRYIQQAEHHVDVAKAEGKA